MAQRGTISGPAALAALSVTLLGCSKSAPPSASERAATQALVDLSKVCMLAEMRGNAGGRFPSAPPCAGVPPVNEHSVPRESSAVVGRDYRPSPSDWTGPWADLPFATDRPLRAVYCYDGAADGSAFSAYVSDDVDGDGVWTMYRREGRIVDGRAVIEPVAAASSRVTEAVREPRCEGLADCGEACDAGSAWGCERYALLLFNGGDVQGAEAAFRKSCDAALGFGCLGFGILLRDLGRTAAAEAAFRRGCDLEEPLACRNLGSLLQTSPNRAPATDAFARACGLGDVEACPVAFRRTGDDDGPAATEPIARTWCDKAPADGCFWLAECLRLTGRDDESRKAALRRACDAGNDTACELSLSVPATDAG
ncbi:MAG: sel1 repeat family protein [Deltaproteobacteria bacterium]|nr:sel1 repeat family protein [Deltaproteobacteria bacterium]